MLNFLQSLVKVANSISSQVYGFTAILLGIGLLIHKDEFAKELIVGGFTMLRGGGLENHIEHADGIKATVEVKP